MRTITSERELLEHIKNNNITLFIGKSNAGKDTLAKRFLRDYGFYGIVTCTTRPMRPGEKDGVDYYYKTVEEFRRLIQTGDIFEYRTYMTQLNGIPDTWYYGSLKQDLDKNARYIAVIEIDGAKSYIDAYGADRIGIVYLDVPVMVRTARAMARPGYSEEEWQRRLHTDDADFSKKRLLDLTAKLGKPIVAYQNYLLESEVN